MIFEWREAHLHQAVRATGGPGETAARSQLTWKQTLQFSGSLSRGLGWVWQAPHPTPNSNWKLSSNNSPIIHYIRGSEKRGPHPN